MFYLIGSIPFLISGVVCHYLAKNRGANTAFWTVMGLVFGPLAIPFMFLSGSAAK
ncbi:hypothetical protein [Cocleimonas flava]|uniref:Uncharacterized protein n=1 Tax=Cocleimonas flava TaxID=634765 RepID=A0A4R1F0F4_9GAMM|nr:hypothetical protein [Cocleimonas flava]TCJ87677.1 hypothetical protein EV695_2190 [Cocleimonas flava]